MRDRLSAEACVHRWHEAIDRYHLNERLGEMLRITESDHEREEKHRAERHTQTAQQAHAVWTGSHRGTSATGRRGSIRCAFTTTSMDR
jgi:hypothetical protein